MTEPAGLRERKRQRTHDTISAVAIALFLDRGFDAVAVADVAAAAEVSKPTLFKYFPTKEDLVLHRIADHSGEAARVVAGRVEGKRPLAALRGHFLNGLRDRDPVTGLNDHPQVLAYHRLVFETPSLAARVASYTEADEAALAGVLDPRGGLAARLAAGQILVVQRILARDNWHRLIGGRTAAQLYRPAVTAADRAFDQLESGLARAW